MSKSEILMPTFRPGTLDARIWYNIVKCNEYNLPEKFSETDVIIDIGAHIGSFSYACWQRGAREVYAYEALHDNYKVLVKNTEDTSIALYNLAVWRSDINYPHILRHTGSSFLPDGYENTGGGNVFWAEESSIEIPAVPLDTILSTVDKVRLLKLDCESAEWPILFTSTQLHRVEMIIGEYHEVNGPNDEGVIPEHARITGIDSFSADILKQHLEQQGFVVEIYSDYYNKDDVVTLSHIGKFLAYK